MIDEKLITALRAQHGSDLTALEADGVVAIVKPVDMPKYRIFKKQVADEVTKALASENLLFGVLVHPSREELMSSIEGRPFILDHFAGEVVRMAGSNVEVSSKKL